MGIAHHCAIIEHNDVVNILSLELTYQRAIKQSLILRVSGEMLMPMRIIFCPVKANGMA